ncbi:hypothetical protein QYM36_019716 [Artemia franciscana]|uniref:Uncharacterized protein n=1 Tax=Artemia franciscana TaxID=6661 RepID=A0AA88H4W3_ARTSF|nr:hypothetical protein QYM36_019716 [Artemia franciscana]
MTLLSSKNRNRRGLVDLEGDLLQFLFGTASQRDVARISKALDQLKLAGKKKTVNSGIGTGHFFEKLFLEYQYQNELMNNLTKKLALVRQEWIIMKNKQDHILDHLHKVELEVAYLKLRQDLLEARQKVHSLEVDLNALSSSRIPLNLISPITLSESQEKFLKVYNHNSDYQQRIFNKFGLIIIL